MPAAEPPDLTPHLLAAFARSYPRACWNCTGYEGPLNDGSYALCTRPGCCRVRSMPEDGCGSFEPDAGVDAQAVPAVHAHALARQAYYQQIFDDRQMRQLIGARPSDRAG